MAGRRTTRWRAALVIGALAGASAVMVPANRDTARAQAPDPFAIPPADELASAATTAVVDMPVPLGETVDLTPALETEWSHFDALASEAWEVQGLASTLGDRPTAAFDLVRDRIGFDAYSGVLRGAEGTLAARAGNAFDRALLLKDLLDDQGFTSRFAFGQLSPETAADLVDRSLEAPATPMSPADFSPFDAAFETAVNDRARRDYALLSEALGNRLSELDADDTSAARSDLKNHAWVQLEQADGTWLDLDPSLPDSQPGQTLTSVERTSDLMPDEDRQTVTLRLVSETLQDGVLSEATDLELSVDPATAADQQILLAFAPATASGGGLMGGGGGGLLAGGGEGSSDFVPVLMINGQAWQGDPIAMEASGGGGGLLGGGGSAIDLSGLFLEVETTSPSAPREIARHAILDRVPPALRAAGGVSSGDLLPIGEVEGVPTAFTTIIHAMLSTGGSSPLTYAWQQGTATEMTIQDAEAASQAGTAGAEDSNLPVQYFPIAVGEQALAIASEQRAIPGVDDAEVRALITRPRVYLASWSADPDDPTRVVTETDLLLDGIRTLPRSGATAGAAARHQLWYGALQGAIETEHVLRTAASFDPADLVLSGVSLEMGQPLTVLSPTDTGSLDPAADPSFDTMLSAGDWLVVPGDPSQAAAWWQVRPDGATKAILAPQLGATRGIGRSPSTGGKYTPPVEGGQKPGGQPGGQQKGHSGRDSFDPNEKKNEEDNAGNEYGTVVDKVGTDTAPVADAGGQALRNEIWRARFTIIKG